MLRAKAQRRVAMATDDRHALLRKVPLFSGLGPSEIERVAELAKEIDVPDGQVLTRQGESGQEFFIVLSGYVDVARDELRIARLGPGDFLVEIALVAGRPRAAPAIADGPARALVR